MGESSYAMAATLPRMALRRSSRLERSQTNGSTPTGAAERDELSLEIGRLVVRVEATRIRQHPYLGAGERLALRSDDGLGPIEANAVRAEPDDGDPLRAMPANLSRERCKSVSQLLIVKFISACGGPRHEVGDAATIRRQETDLSREQQSIGETRREERRPKSIPGAGKMKTRRARIPTGIDSAEKHVKRRREDIGDRACVRAGEFFASRRRLAIGDWRLAIGDWRLAIGDWRLAIGDWRLAIGDWRLNDLKSPIINRQSQISRTTY